VISRPIRQWGLLLGVALAQVAIAAGLRTTRLSVIRAATARLRPLLRWAMDVPDADAIWAIEATARRLGSLSTCLVQALTAELVVAGADQPVLRIGVRRTETGAVEEHAWLVRGDRVLIGGTCDQFVPLVGTDGAST